jgi:hypothetical protein
MFYNKLIGGKDLVLDNLAIYSSNSNAFVVKDNDNNEVFKIDTQEKKAYLNAELLLVNPPVTINWNNIEIEDILIRVGKNNSILGDIKDMGLYLEYKNPQTNQINYSGLIRKAGNQYGYALFKNYNGDPDLSPWSSSNYDNLHLNDLYCYNQNLNANGSSSNPSISFIESKNSGIYYNSSDASLNMSVQSSTKMKISSNRIDLYDHLYFNDKNIVGANYVFCNGFFGVNMNGSQPFIYQVGNITSGSWSGSIIQSLYGGTGNSSYLPGQILIGNNSNTLTKAYLTSNNLSITNGDGSISINTTQNLNTSSNPTFNGLLLNNTLNMNSNNITNVNNLTATTLTGTIQTATQTNITKIGTIIEGVWNSTIINSDYGGTGYSSYSPGEILIGNNLNKLTKNTLTGTSNQIVITNGNGSITLSTPQDINTTSPVQFGSMKLTNGNLNMNTYNITNAGTINATTGYNGLLLTANQSNITGLGNITSGVWQSSPIAYNYGGTGNTSYLNGQLLIGSTLNGLTKGYLTSSNLTITNGDGSISINMPQALTTTSSPTFNSISLTSGLSYSSDLNINNYNITNVNGLTATTLTGTIQTAAQTNINKIASSLLQSITITPPLSNYTSAPFQINGIINSTTANGSYYGSQIAQTFQLPAFSGTTNSTSNYYGVDIYSTIDLNSLNTHVGSFFGLRVTNRYVNITAVTSTYVFQNIYGIYINNSMPTMGSGKGINNYYGLYIAGPDIGGSGSGISNGYQIYLPYIANNFITNKYGIYSLNNNFFTGITLNSTGGYFNGNATGLIYNMGFYTSSASSANTYGCQIDAYNAGGNGKLLLRSGLNTQGGELQFRNANNGFTIFNQTTSLDLNIGRLLNGNWLDNIITIPYNSGSSVPVVKIPNGIAFSQNTQLSYYNTVSYTCNITGAITTSITCQASRIGNMVIISIPSCVNTYSVSNAAITLSAVASDYRHSNALGYNGILIGNNNGVNMQMAYIVNSNGTISIGNSSVNPLSFFSASASATIGFYGFTINYTV